MPPKAFPPNKPKKPKKKSNSDSDYTEDSEGSQAMEDNRSEAQMELDLREKEKKRKADKPAAKKVGRPAKVAKYEFTAKDKLAIQDWILGGNIAARGGMDYAALQSEHFQNCNPEVSTRDLNNFVNHNDYLKGLVKDEEHKRIKEKQKKIFDLTVQEAKTPVACKVKVENAPVLSERSFPFYSLVSETHYAWILRHDLGAVVAIDVDDEAYTMHYQVTNSALLKSELASLEIVGLLPLGKTIEEVFDFDNSQSINKFSIAIPADALIADGGRFDHDTPLGGIVEIYFPRMKKVNKLNFKGKLFLHLDTAVSTTVPLAMRAPNLDEAAANAYRETEEERQEAFNTERIQHAAEQMVLNLEPKS